MIWIHMNSCSSSIPQWLPNVAFISDDFQICARGCPFSKRICSSLAFLCTWQICTLPHSGVEELFVSPYNVEASLELMPYSTCLLSKDLYCKLDIFLRRFLWLRYRWYKSGIHGRCWGAATCPACLSLLLFLSIIKSKSLLFLYPTLSIQYGYILLFSSDV